MCLFEAGAYFAGGYTIATLGVFLRIWQSLWRRVKDLGSFGRWLRDLEGRLRGILQSGIPADEPIGVTEGGILGLGFTAGSLKRSDVTIRSASTTYTFIFALVPLLTTTFLFLASFPGLRQQKAQIEETVLGYFLPAAAENVKEYIEAFSNQAAAAGAVSTLLFFFTTLLLLRSIEGSFNHIFRAMKRRSWAQSLEVLALSYVVGILTVLAFVIVGGTARELAVQVERLDIAGTGAMMTRFGLWSLELIVAWLVFALACKTLPNTRVQWRNALLGGMIVGTAWHFLKDVFTWYVANFTSYENVYGALGTVPVFLLWTYLSFFLLFAGGNIAFVSQELRTLIEEKRLGGSVSHFRAYWAVALTTLLSGHFERREGRQTLAALAEELGVATLFIEQTVGPLVRAGYVLEHVENDVYRYLLAVPAESLSIAEVVKAAVGDSLDVPPGGQAHHSFPAIAELFLTSGKSRDAILGGRTIAQFRGMLDELQGDDSAAEA